MKKLVYIFVLGSLVGLTACSINNLEQDKNSSEKTITTQKENSEKMEEKTMSTIQVKVIVNEQVLPAEFYDNATSNALMEQFPLTVPMMDLYSREMCYRFEEALPANEAETSGYEVGDIAYWTPRHSFVIFYEQNNEVIADLQKVGRITSGVDEFKQTGDVEVTFDIADSPLE